MIGEIENRSTFLLVVKADVETQGDFVQSLATEVRAVSFTNIEDLLAFVSWLDEELIFLVDERAVLKHFDWSEGKDPNKEFLVLQGVRFAFRVHEFAGGFDA